MSTIGGNNSIQDGLVFAYDTGNTRKSFRGEPTVNLFSNTDFSLSWEFYNTSYNNGKLTNTTSTTDSKFTLLDSTLVNGQIYTQSILAKADEHSIIQIAPSSSFSSGPYINYNLLDGTITGNAISSGKMTHIIDGWYKCDFTATAIGTGGRMVFAIVSDIGSTRLASYTGIIGEGLYIKDPQIEQKNYATPFTPDTRTVTDSLLDLTKNTTIDVTNTSFDSEGQMFFDGVNDHIGVSNNMNLTSDVTISAIVKQDSSNQVSICSQSAVSNREFNFRIEATGHLFCWFSTDGASANLSYNTNVVVPLGVWNHVVVTFGGSEVNFFLNGNLIYTNATSVTRFTNNSLFSIGSWAEDVIGTFNFNGQIPIVKIYNKVLTPLQVKQNFNSVKSRFNIT